VTVQKLSTGKSNLSNFRHNLKKGEITPACEQIEQGHIKRVIVALFWGEGIFTGHFREQNKMAKLAG